MIRQSYIGNRFEFKYPMDPLTAARVEAYVNRIGLVRDDHSKDGAYSVNSFYFDTPVMNDYYDKDGSFLIRKKLRARTYDTRWRDNPERVWLEVKHKRNMNIRKVRAEISPETWAALVRGAPLSSPSFSSRRDEEGFREFFYHFKKELYRPSVIVQYLRTAYLGVFTNPIRITFDRHIMVCRADDPLGEERMVPVSGSTVIMEVKYNRLLPWWFTRLVRGFGLSRDDYSKYRNAVALFRGYHRIPISK